MNVPLLTPLIHLIEEIIESNAPIVENAAVASVEEDPKVQAVQSASAELLLAAKNLKAAINTPSIDTPGYGAVLK